MRNAKEDLVFFRAHGLVADHRRRKAQEDLASIRNAGWFVGLVAVLALALLERVRGNRVNHRFPNRSNE